MLFGLFIVAACSPQVEETPEQVSEEVDVSKDEIIIGERLSIYSDILSEDRAYWVHLPASYDGEKNTQFFICWTETHISIPLPGL